MRRAPLVASLVAGVLAATPLAVVAAQRGGGPADTLRLGSLEADAARRDPRAAQVDLQRARTALRLRSLAAERLPALELDGQGQYQSQVTSLPIHLPNVSVPAPPHDTYDAHVGARQRLLDPTLDARRTMERAQLAQSEAQIGSTIYALRQQVDQSFFDAASLQSQREVLATVVTDLEAQFTAVEARVRAGTALAGDAAAIEAELLRRREDVRAVDADRLSALAVLSDLTGRAIATNVVLALPDSEVPAAGAAAADTLRARPEYAAFTRARDLLAAQEDVLSAQDKPRVSAFARVGYGKPGLDALADRFDSYWLAGVQLQWTPFNWGTTARDREALEVQRQITTTDEAAFTAALRRAVERDVATMQRLEGTLAADERIVTLRERVLRETTLRFDEGVITAADYVNRQTDLLDARLARAAHRVQLAQARAHYLTTLGVEVR